MKFLALLIALQWLYGMVMIRADILGGPIINTTNGNLYYLLSENTWSASEREARTLGGHLVTINDESEQLWVYQMFAFFDGNTNRALWIGLNDRAVEASFVWANAEPVTYTNWAPNEPGNSGQFGTEDAAHLWPPGFSNSGQWNDLTETVTRFTRERLITLHGVVEVEPPKVEPLRVEIQVASVAVRWNSQQNKRYQIQYATAVAPTTWFDLGAPVSGTGTSNVVFDSVLSNPRRIYRVVELP